MNKLIKFPDVRRTTEEACQWLMSIEDGLSEDEEGKLKEWLATDPRNPRALIQLAELWEQFDSLSELADIFPLSQYRPRRGAVFNLRAVSIAASLIVALGVTTYFMAQRPSDLPRPSGATVALPVVPESGIERANGRSVAGFDVSQRSYQTAIGEQLSARLPDGSVTTLNTDTSLEVEYTSTERRVIMRHGEVSFDVAKDAVRPFRVVTSRGIVQAVGTVFNIEIGVDDKLEVTVSEGRVRFLPIAAATQANDIPRSGDGFSAPDLTVSAGERATIDGLGENVRSIDRTEIQEQLAWQQGVLIYRGASLEHVLADVSRYTTLKLTIADERIRDKRVGGYFRAGDIDALLVALRESFDIEPLRVGDEILLTASQ